MRATVGAALKPECDVWDAGIIDMMNGFLIVKDVNDERIGTGNILWQNTCAGTALGVMGEELFALVTQILKACTLYEGDLCRLTHHIVDAKCAGRGLVEFGFFWVTNQSDETAYTTRVREVLAADVGVSHKAIECGCCHRLWPVLSKKHLGHLPPHFH